MSSANDVKAQPNGADKKVEDEKSPSGLFPWPAKFGRNAGAAKPTAAASHLFSPFEVRGLSLKNRVVVSPMCMYSSPDGFFTDWHLVHLGSLAAGGAALVFTEATAVAPEGRISPYDAGLWSDEHAAMHKRVVDFVHSQKAAAGIQLAHAGRKASTDAPWVLQGSETSIAASDPRGWQPLGPSPLAWSDRHAAPAEVSLDDIKRITENFVSAAKRAAAAGYDVIEVHAAHGYLLSSFLSPTSNKRADAYGGSLENRARLLFEVVAAVRQVWQGPLFVRVSCHEWVDGDGWTPDDSAALAKMLKAREVDVIDCSSGGNSSKQRIQAGPGFQVPFAEKVKRESGISAMAVGMITDPKQAEEIVASGRADLVALARELLRDPHWPLRAAHTLGVDVEWPAQYERAKPKL